MTEPADFTCEGLPQEFRAATLMPPGEVIEIVVYLVENRTLPATHNWVDAQGAVYEPNSDGPPSPTGEVPF